MDEQDVARDRSVSPNFHSLIYGDSKKKTDSKADYNNGSDKPESRASAAATDTDEATLAEASSL